MLNRLCSGFCLIVLASAAAFAAEPFRLELKDAKLGELPRGWKAAKTGEGPVSVWKVLEDPSAPSSGKTLAQTSADGPNSLFNLCIAEDVKFADVDISVSLKANAGKVDRGGGLIWRCKDADNYYIARANALEDNVTIYHTIKGKRASFKNIDTKVAPALWHTLRVEFEDNKFAVIFDGKKVVEATDDSFSDAGKVGVWTKADSVTLFDDFTWGSK